MKVRQNFKFVALPVPEIKGGYFKLWAAPGYAHALFSAKWAVVRMDPENVQAKFEVCSSTRS